MTEEVANKPEETPEPENKEEIETKSAPEQESTPEAETTAPVPEEEPEEEFTKKKIRLMSMAEIDKAITRSQKKMGGSQSFYVRHLMARKAELENKSE